MTDTAPAIIHSCCIEGLRALKAENTQQIHLTLTSPPYYNVKDYVAYPDYPTYLEMLKTVFALVYDITVEGRMCCVNISNILIPRESRSHESARIPLAFHFVPLMEAIGWKFIEDILWIKPEGAAKNRNGGFFQHRQPVAYKPNIVNEYIFVFQKPSTRLIDSIVRSYSAVVASNSKVVDEYERTNVWKINPETKSQHPAPYPEELATKIIQYYSFCGDMVLDPFAGSGTTLVAAFRHGRRAIGFEIHAEYIAMYEAREVADAVATSSLSLNKEDYRGLDKEVAIKKMGATYNKKALFQLMDNRAEYKGYSKRELLGVVYATFMNST